MRKMRYSGNHNLIGLDIGSSSIKVCQVEKKQKRYHLKSFGLANLPPSAISHGTIKEPAVIAGILKSLLANLNLNSPEVVFALSGHSVIVKQITLPLLTEKELAQSLPFEAKQHIPFELSEVNLDFHIVGPAREDPDFMSVLLVAAKKEVLGDYLEVLNLSGLEAVVVDVAAFALANAYEANYALDAQPVALIDLGAGQTTLMVVHQDGPIYTREISMGGSQLTETIQALGHLSFEEAEKLKLQGNREDDHLEQLAPAFLETLRSWSLEIKRALDFLITSDPSSKPFKLVLSGGSSLLPGFSDLLSEEMQLPAEFLNPFAQVQLDPAGIDPNYLRAVGPQAAIAFGLSIRHRE
jgi:type IV pilus assembly protein PilM